MGGSLRSAGRSTWLTAATATALVVASRWPYRSHRLFSWDSANYALATLRIDIGAHRPHPPGYLAYVIAARALNLLTHDVNTALVAWNVVATALGAIVVAWLASELSENDSSRSTAAWASALFCISSPLLWFYGEVAEIYPSEMLVSLLVAAAAWRQQRGHRDGVYWCAAALALAALFKITAAMLMLPLAAYTWWVAKPADRARAAALLTALTAVVAFIFLTLQPNLPSVLWSHFMGATAGSRLIDGPANLLKTFNRNLRDTFTAAVSALGIVNGVGLIVWLALGRRLPARLDRSFVLLWMAPWIAVFLLVHIGKPGYILPLLPLACLVLADFVARLPRPLTCACLALSVTVNAAQFLWLRPPAASTVGQSRLYRDRSRQQRLVSDLQGIATPTRSTIVDSDRRLISLQEFVASTCPGGSAVIVAGETVDYRRVMWYFPEAWVIDVSGADVPFVGRHTDSTSVPAGGMVLETACPVIWLGNADGAAGSFTPPGATQLPLLGSFTPAGRIKVTPRSLGEL